VLPVSGSLLLLLLFETLLVLLLSLLLCPDELTLADGCADLPDVWVLGLDSGLDSGLELTASGDLLELPVFWLAV
jgi:hypothetical protein